jgi:signal peptide peptidase-like protein 2B
MLSFLIAYLIALAWLVIAFTDRNAEARTFFWITQNIFGSCMCIMFLKTIRLNSIEVASILLVVAFFYDIFFVFITPYIFKKSIMITVATSGGPPTADASWCEKYPDDANCQGGNPLPMLLTIPRFFDYQGGASLLGLGDIVLPGLLLSFAARYDAAKSLVGIVGGGSGRIATTCPEQRLLSSCLCFRGYFGPLVIAYAIGLFMANAAVYLMEMGQPALLYLVPSCLGTMSYIGWRQGELKDLWDGPRAIKAADAILYGEDPAGSSQSQGAHAPLPSEDVEGDDMAAPPSAIDGDDEHNEGVTLTMT